MSNNEYFGTLMANGVDLFYDEQYQMARKNFYDALSIDPTDWEATVLASITDACLTCGYGTEDQAIRRLSKVADKIVTEGHRIHNDYNNPENVIEVLSCCIVKSAYYIVGVMNNEFEYQLSARYGLRWIRGTYYPLAEELGGILYYLGDNVFNIIGRQAGKESAISLWEAGNVFTGFCKDNGGIFKRIGISSTIRRYKRKIRHAQGVFKTILRSLVIIAIIIGILYALAAIYGHYMEKNAESMEQQNYAYPTKENNTPNEANTTKEKVNIVVSANTVTVNNQVQKPANNQSWENWFEVFLQRRI